MILRWKFDPFDLFATKFSYFTSLPTQYPRLLPKELLTLQVNLLPTCAGNRFHVSVMAWFPFILKVMKQPWPGMARTIYGNHERFEEVYFSKFPGYYTTGDGVLQGSLIIVAI